MRRRAPMVLVFVGVVALLGSYIGYTQFVVGQLRTEAQRQGRMLARTYRTVADPRANESSYLGVLVDIIEQGRRAGGIPMILLDPEGRIQDWANLPESYLVDSSYARSYIPTLEAINRPIVEQGVGTIYFGDTRLVRGLRYVPALQISAAILLAAVGFYTFLVRARADREHVWAGMARESAHQLGTPLMSLSGWISLLDDEVVDQGTRADPLLRSAVSHMRSDLERLERVAHRFERIGRDPRRETVDVGALVERIATYFRARVPKGTRAIVIESHLPADSITVEGDAVLLEWVLESLTKNAIDALAGRGGRIDLTAEQIDGGARIRVADDGPGVPRELRSRIFEAGYSTKERGWGIGLSLSRRIVQENHGGRLVLASTDRGAAFDVILR